MRILERLRSATGEAELKLLLVRAAETAFGRQGRVEGDVDVPLTPSGRRFSRQVLEDVLLPGGGVDAVYSADHQGSLETAEILAEANGGRVRTLLGLKGMCLGLWEGQLETDVRHRHSRIYDCWIRDPLAITPPAGEDMERAYSRAEKALRTIRKKHREGGVVAVVAPPTMIALLYCCLTCCSPRDVFSVGDELGPVEVVSAASKE